MQSCGEFVACDFINSVDLVLLQANHRFTTTLQRRIYGHATDVAIHPLNEEKAVQAAADLLGELFVFSVSQNNQHSEFLSLTILIFHYYLSELYYLFLLGCWRRSSFRGATKLQIRGQKRGNAQAGIRGPSPSIIFFISPWHTNYYE